MATSRQISGYVARLGVAPAHPFYEYFKMLASLRAKKAFGREAIYPAMGVDLTFAPFASVVGLNWFPYEEKENRRCLSYIFAEGTVDYLLARAEANIKYLSRIDVCNSRMLLEQLQALSGLTPKSLIIKGLFQSAFRMERNFDTERFDDVPIAEARHNAECWIKEMIEWMKVGDKLVVFDPEFNFLSNFSNLTQLLSLSIPPVPAHDDKRYILALPEAVRVYQKTF